MPQNALAPTPVNAFNMQAYAAQSRVVPTSTGRDYQNVYSALLPQLLQAQFPEFARNVEATVTADPVKNINNAGEYTPLSNSIALDPVGINRLRTVPLQGVGYVGAPDTYNTTTEETLNALRTLMHEGYHARLDKDIGFWREPSAQLAKKMSREQYRALMTDLATSGLPSMIRNGQPKADADIINEALSTIVPTLAMQRKNMVTRQNARFAREYERLAKRYPEFGQIVNEWSNPELFK
jgi:hypothetical protein